MSAKKNGRADQDNGCTGLQNLELLVALAAPFPESLVGWVVMATRQRRRGKQGRTRGRTPTGSTIWLLRPAGHTSVWLKLGTGSSAGRKAWSIAWRRQRSWLCANLRFSIWARIQEPARPGRMTKTR